MATSVEPRFRKRIPCRLTRSRSTFSGVVLDFSRRGLFVQASVAARTGDEIEIVLSRSEREPDVVLNAQVVWQRKVPLALRSTVQEGLGLQISYASESYYTLLAEASQGSPLTR